MDAITLLKKDHELVKKLLAEGEETTERAEKTRTELFARLKSELQIHERIEEEVLYPALRDNPKSEEIAYEAYEEHHVVDTILEELETTPTDSPEWLAKFTVAKENLEHHIEEEEGELFPKARQILSDDQLERMGARMEEIKSLAKQVDGKPA
ncbi:MAG: hemerythrin domain-containing protein [Chloroflexota bacterium]